MKNLSIETLETVKSEFSNDVLANEVIIEIESYGEDWGSKLSDIIQYGCVSGSVGSLIYYVDTIAFHDNYEKEIDELISDLEENTGMTFAEIVGDKVESYDIDGIKNYKSWLAFEETARKISDFLEDLEEENE